MRKWDPGHNDDANFSSSDDEDEMSRLKPREGNPPLSVQQQQQQLLQQQQQQLQQQQQQSIVTPTAGKTNKSSRGTRTGGPSASFGRNYFLGPHPASGSGATSPNDSDNTYAEASLLAHGRYEHNSSDGGGQIIRNDEGKFAWCGGDTLVRGHGFESHPVLGFRLLPLIFLFHVIFIIMSRRSVTSLVTQGVETQLM